jgi:hypothetical protein
VEERAGLSITVSMDVVGERRAGLSVALSFWKSVEGRMEVFFTMDVSQTRTLPTFTSCIYSGIVCGQISTFMPAIGH